MEFNVKKSKIMAFKEQDIPAHYTLNGTVLEQVDKSTYLRVTLQANLKFDNHIQNKILLANKQLGMIKRALHWAPEKVKLMAYKSLCLPHLDYASAVWDPYTTKEIVIVIVTYVYISNYSNSLLHSLNVTLDLAIIIIISY